MSVPFFCVLLTACAVPALLALESRATITGTVSDPQGAAVLPFLNTGAYAVTVTAPGFKPAVGERIELGISERKQLDFKLEVGGISEQVTVTATAELLNTANAVRGTTIDARKVADLPLLGKNPYTSAYHAAGVLHINPQGSITDRAYDNGGMYYLSIAGGRPFTNEFLLDGAPNTNTERRNPGSLSFVPPPEATEEVAVLTNNYDAQYGRTGGGVVSATLKSGTN